MAVFTDITAPQYQIQLSKIEKAYGLAITSIEGIIQGSSDSLFKITTEELVAPLVLTIHETPDVTPAGLTNEAAQSMIRYMDFIAGAIDKVRDRTGALVNVAVLKPLQAYSDSEGQAPFVELDFDGVVKPASIVPFINGRSYVNSPEERIRSDDAFHAGQLLAAYLITASSYPNPERFPVCTFERYAGDIVELSEVEKGWSGLGYVLSGRRSKGDAAALTGQTYLDELKVSGQRLVEQWRRLVSQEDAFPRTIVHRDLFADNVLIDEKGRMVLLDFSEVSYGSIGVDLGVALISWGSQDGKLIGGNIARFLQGFDSVIALTAAQLAQLPLYSQFGAFRWETFRIQRIFSQDPYQMTMRSPAEFQSLRKVWQDLEQVFVDFSSLEDLVSWADDPDRK
ncbi:MAG TPA: phosphotransferase [candidate division Zixibacteria bacterium]|nr:phosphotransferase [candidate division Zixibacteria bacterium]